MPARPKGERGTAHQRGYNARWQKARVTYLRQHPLCAECQRRGRLTPAKIVDHITPHKGDQTLFWDTENWQPLCKPCHDQKTAREDGGFGNQGGKLEPGCDTDGIPTDGRHHWN